MKVLSECIVESINGLFQHTYFNDKNAFVQSVKDHFYCLASNLELKEVDENHDEITLKFADCKIVAVATWKNSTPMETNKKDKDGNTIYAHYDGKVLSNICLKEFIK